MDVGMSEDNRKLSQTKLFIAAMTIPLVIAIFTSLAIYYSKDASQFLVDFWTNYKIPMAIASLSIPLVAWVTANHRSEQTMKGLELQREKRLYEMYYEQQKHFEKVMGRRIKNAKFQYITEEDLPVIFSELYEFNHLHQKGAVTLKAVAVEQINRFVLQTGKIIYGFYEKLLEHKELNPNQKSILDGFIHQMYTFLQNNLHQLSDDIGVRYIDLSDASVEIFSRAYSEVLHLTYYMGDDFKEVWDAPLEENGNTRDENVLKTFSAVEECIRVHMGVVGNASFSNLQSDVSSRQIIKMIQATSLQNLVMDFCQKLLEDLKIRFDLIDIHVVEGQYDKYQFPTREDLPTLELWFDEVSSAEGDLVLTTPDTEDRARFKILDDKKKVDGKEQIRYSIDDDMGRAFIRKCFSSLEALLT
jgi:hypothetical protein